MRRFLLGAIVTISGDHVQLQQVILNLLLHAADAMASIEDRPRLLRVQTQIDGNDSVKLLVQDCGVGLDPHGIEKLFDPFHTTKAHGLGIGLAISRTIIESHEGKLWALANDGPAQHSVSAFLAPLGLSACVDFEPPGHVHQVDESGSVHFFHDLTSMSLDSDLTDIQFETDLLVHESPHDESHDFTLALGQRVEPLLQLTLSSCSLQIGFAAQHRLMNRLDHHCVIERLGQEFSRTCFHRPDGCRNIAVARYEYDRYRGLVITYALLDVETAEIWKIDVQDHAARDYGWQLHQERFCRFEQQRFPALVLNQEFQGLTD